MTTKLRIQLVIWALFAVFLASSALAQDLIIISELLTYVCIFEVL